MSSENLSIYNISESDSEVLLANEDFNDIRNQEHSQDLLPPSPVKGSAS